jgi:TetR/AcrR family transcriptional repressor of bet genes
MATSAKRTKTIMARRLDLIQGTIRSIATLGYNNSTVQTICEAAGLSRGLIGHYFKGKDDLLLEAFRYLVGRADEETRTAVRAVGNDPLHRLLAATEATFNRAIEDREGGMVWLACWGVAPWVPEMHELQRKLWRRYRNWVERMIAQAADERGLKVDAKRAALTYAQMVDGFWLGWLSDNEAYSPEIARDIICDWLRDLFGEGRKTAARGSPTRKPASPSAIKKPARKAIQKKKS